MIEAYDLWEAHDRQQEQALNRMPVCCKCKEHIQDEYGYRLDGDLYCYDCAQDWLDDQREYIEEEV